MEYSKNGLDLILWPNAWHKRLSATVFPLIPMIIFVGVYDVLSFTPSILDDYLLKGGPAIALKIVCAILVAVIIGALDVVLFAWPIADLCRYLARRTEKFIAPGFHVILMKSYALSHMVYVPLLLLTRQFGDRPAILQEDFSSLQLLALITFFWQLAILLRTINVKCKLEFPAKLVPGVCIYFWFSFEGFAVGYLLQLAYNLMGSLGKIS